MIDSNPGDDELKDLVQRIHAARVNLNYTIYFPLTEKYISLYPNKKLRKRTTDDDPANQNEGGIEDSGSEAQSEQKHTSSSGRPSTGDNQENQIRNTQNNHDTTPDTEANAKPPMWHIVEKCTEKGQEMLNLLRDGNLELDIASGVSAGEESAGILSKQTNKTKGEATSMRKKKSLHSSVSDEHVPSRAKPKTVNGDRDTESRNRNRNRAARRKDEARRTGPVNTEYEAGPDKGSSAEESDGGFFEE